jgi:hypothetical protein
MPARFFSGRRQASADIEHMAVDPETAQDGLRDDALAQDVATQSANRLLEVRMIVRACRATRSG